LLYLVRCFQRGEPAPSAETLAAELEIPPRLLGGILELLQRQGLVVALVGADGVSGFLPAREPDTIAVAALLGSIASDGTDYLPPTGCAEHAVVIALVERLAQAAGGSLNGITLRGLAEQMEGEGESGS